MRTPIPVPPRGSPMVGTLIQYVTTLYTYLRTRDEQEVTFPTPILLATLDSKAKASQDGILMFDPVAKKVVVSVAGAWVALL